jgi:hypothetical protein
MYQRISAYPTHTTYSGPEDLLVVPRDPDREIDVEVGMPLVGVARRDIGQRAVPLVEREHDHLDRHDAAEHERDVEATQPCGDRNANDAQHEEGPRHRVDELHRAQACSRG